jgi:hypothetical protein
MIAAFSPRRETLIGRKVGSLFILLILTSIIFLSGTTTTLTLILTLVYIGLIVATTVQLFGFSRFLEFSLYRYIPTYTELDAHIKTSMISAYEFCRIAFGGQKRTDYQTQYTQILSDNTVIKTPTTPYFAPVWII